MFWTLDIRIMYFLLRLHVQCHQVFTYSQRIRLRKISEKDPNPTRAFRSELAAEMGVTLYQITNWFSNNRCVKKLKEESVHDDILLTQNKSGKITYAITCIDTLINFVNR